MAAPPKDWKEAFDRSGGAEGLRKLGFPEEIVRRLEELRAGTKTCRACGAPMHPDDDRCGRCHAVRVEAPSVEPSLGGALYVEGSVAKHRAASGETRVAEVKPAPLVEIGEIFQRGGAFRRVAGRRWSEGDWPFPPGWLCELEGGGLASEGALLGETEYYRRRDASVAESPHTSEATPGTDATHQTAPRPIAAEANSLADLTQKIARETNADPDGAVGKRYRLTDADVKQIDALASTQRAVIAAAREFWKNADLPGRIAMAYHVALGRALGAYDDARTSGPGVLPPAFSTTPARGPEEAGIFIGQHEIFIAFETVSHVPMFVGLGRRHLERQIERDREANTHPEHGYPYDYYVAGPFEAMLPKDAGTQPRTGQAGKMSPDPTWEEAIQFLRDEANGLAQDGHADGALWFDRAALALSNGSRESNYPRTDYPGHSDLTRELLEILTGRDHGHLPESLPRIARERMAELEALRSRSETAPVPSPGEKS